MIYLDIAITFIALLSAYGLIVMFLLKSVRIDKDSLNR